MKKLLKKPIFPILLTLILIGIKLFYKFEITGPTLFGDEFIYINNTRSFIAKKFNQKCTIPTTLFNNFNSCLTNKK